MLVGGFGTRLRPLTLDRPKQMLPLGSRTMFERVIRSLADHGVSEAVVSLGYRPDAFIDAYPDGRCGGVTLRYAVEDEPLDTAGAIRFAAIEGGVDETFLVVNGDVLTDLDYSWLVSRHREFGGEATIHLTAVEEPSRYGVVPTDDAGRVERFVEKPDPGTEPTNLINAGTYVMDPAVLDRIAADGRVSVERETFPTLCAAGVLFAIASEDYWIDAGTPASYLRANLDLVDGTRSTEAAIAPSATVSDGASVLDSVVGPGAVIDAGASVERSVIMGGARVESGARVADSIVAEGAIIHAGAEVTDLSVVGFGATVGDGRRLSGATEPDPSEWNV